MSDEPTATETPVEEISADEQRKMVRERYSSIATDSSGCCNESESSCCEETDGYESQTRSIYDDEIDDVTPDADLGLGCGNPTAIASLETGETVLDLGSGAGFDCFLAAREVGSAGQVIGVDMTPAMIEKARENAAQNDASNVAFRLGEIEHLPVADGTVDVIISNCVVNLSPDKPQVFADAYRTLRPGGRLAISDVVLTAELPSDVRRDPESVSACVAGASPIADLESMLQDVGFTDISITPKEDSEEFIREWDDERDLSEYIVSANIEGRKPDA
jgi:SAM-dependent methyltransferase